MLHENKCAAVILNYNDASTTLAFVDLIKNYEIIDYVIVVDNCSPDGSYSILKSASSMKVKVVQTPKNGGYGYGNNYGVRIAKELECKIALICNSDIRINEECITRVVESFFLISNMAICSAIQVDGYTKKQVVPWRLPTTLDYVKNSLVLAKRLYPNEKYTLKNKTEKVDCVPGAFLAVDIEKFWESGGYDEGLFLFCEEATIAARTLKKGYTTYCLTDCEYIHFHSTSIKKSYPKYMNTFKMLLKSRRYYLINYRNIRGWRLFVVDFMFLIGFLEKSVLHIMD